jgi:hypothetical protein
MFPNVIIEAVYICFYGKQHHTTTTNTDGAENVFPKVFASYTK